MLAEFKPFEVYSQGLSQLTDAMHSVAEGNAYTSPALDWLRTSAPGSPALAYDLTAIERRMQWLAGAGNQFRIWPLLAVKSGPFKPFLEMGARYLSGFSVSNAAEYARLPTDLSDKTVCVSSPRLPGDLSPFMTNGNEVLITVDSDIQLAQCQAHRPRMPYLLRVRSSDLLAVNDPGYYDDSRFGFAQEQLGRLAARPDLQSMPAQGFHVHHGGDSNSVSTYLGMITALLALARRLPGGLRCINLGGGWHPLSREEFWQVLEQARASVPDDCDILVEPGRWYGEESGFAAGTIVNESAAGDTVNIVLDLSRDCHLQHSAVQLIYPIPEGAEKFCEVEFFGATSAESDRIGKFLLPYRDNFLAESGFRTGNQVIFSAVSTYSAAWNRSFNGVPQADVHWLHV